MESARESCLLPIYALLLRPNGKVETDLYMYKTKAMTGDDTVIVSDTDTDTDDNDVHNDHDENDGGRGSDEILADVDRASIPRVMKTLVNYSLRKDIRVEDVSDEYSVVVSGSALAHAGSAGSAGSAAAGTHMSHGESRSCEKTDEHLIAMEEDVRMHSWPAMRGLRKRGIVKGFMHADETHVGDAESAENAYIRERMMLGVFEGQELGLGVENAMPLEWNMDGLNAVSFTKGCYVGQELTARTKFRGIVRKRVVPIWIDDIANCGDDLVVGAELHGVTHDSDDGDEDNDDETVGEVEGSGTKRRRRKKKKRADGVVLGIVKDDTGPGAVCVAKLRLSIFSNPARSSVDEVPQHRRSVALQVAGGTSVITATRPEWWPLAWGNEDDGAS